MSKKTNHTERGGSHAVKRHVRFDRIAVVVIPLLLIILLIIALCMRSLQKSGKLHLEKKDEPSTVAVTTTLTAVPTESSETTPAVATGTSEPQESSAAEKEITLSSSDIAKGHLIVVNKENAYSFPAGDPKLAYVHEARNDSYTVSDMEVQLEEETLEHLSAMMADYEAETGFDGMQVFSGYRTKADQDSRYENGSTDFPGGCSDYHTGRSFNLKIDFGDGTSDYYNAEKYPDYSWIAEHAAEYGFVVRYPEGKDSLTGDESRTYTFRYVGVPHAVYMTAHKLCLEEYVEKLQGYTADKPLNIQTENADYAVYYAAADTSSIHTSVIGEDYSVSGDNIGGFIITCNLE